MATFAKTLAPEWTARSGKVVQYISDSLGVIKCKSQMILFHKKSVHFPGGVFHNLQTYIPLGKGVHFDAEFVNYGDRQILAATSVWRNRKQYRQKCPASVYIDYFASSNLHERETGNIETGSEFDRGCDNPVLNNSQMDSSFLTSQTQRAYSNKNSPLTHKNLDCVSFDINNILPGVKQSIVRGITGIVVQYLSDNFGVMKCLIFNYPRHVFLSRSVLNLPKHLGTVPLCSLLPVNEKLVVTINVFNKGKFTIYTIRSGNINLNTFQFKPLNPSSDIHSGSAQGTKRPLPEKFTKLKGVVSSYSSKKEGVIQYEVDGTVMKINFHRKNVYFPENKTGLTLKTYLPVKSQVYFDVPPQYSCDNTKFTASVVYADAELGKSFSKNTSNNEINGNETFFCTEGSKIASVVEHVSEEEALVVCKVLSVNCLIGFRKSDVKTSRKTRDFDFVGSFPIGTKVYFDAKIFGFNKGIKIKVVDIFPFEVMRGIVSKVMRQLIKVKVKGDGQELIIDVNKGNFQSYKASNVNDLRKSVSEGDEVMVEMIVFKNSSGSVATKLHRCVKMEASKIPVSAETGSKNHRACVNVLTSITQNNEAVDVKVSSDEWRKTQETRHSEVMKEMDDVSENSNLYQKQNFVNDWQKLENNSYFENILISELEKASLVVTDFLYFKRLENFKVRNYFETCLEGRIVKYLSNDLGIVRISVGSMEHDVFFTRYKLVLPNNVSLSVPLSCLLPVNDACNVDVEVCVHQDNSQFFRVKAIKTMRKKSNDFTNDFQNIPPTTNDTIDFQSTPLITGMHQFPVNRFLTLKGSIASHTTSQKGKIMYKMFGSFRYIDFSKENIYFEGTNFDLTLEECVPVGTQVIFSSFFDNFAVENNVASFVCVDGKDANPSTSCNTNAFHRDETKNVHVTYFCFIPNMLGIIMGHISDDEAVIKCEIESVTCMTSFNKRVASLGKSGNDSQLSVDFPIGAEIKFSAKVICFNGLIKINVLEIRPVFCFGTVTKINPQSFNVKVNCNGKEEHFKVRKKFFRILGRTLTRLQSLRNYISVGDPFLVQISTTALSKGLFKECVLKAEKLDKSVPYKELCNILAGQHNMSEEIWNQICRSGNVSQKKEDVCSGIVCDINEATVVISRKNSSSLTFKRKYICLYGVCLHNYNIKEIFREGMTINFSLCCGKKKLCVGQHPKPETKDNFRSKLHDFCIEMNINIHIMKRLVEDFHSLYNENNCTHSKFEVSQTYISHVHNVQHNVDNSLISQQIAENSNTEFCDAHYGRKSDDKFEFSTEKHFDLKDGAAEKCSNITGSVPQSEKNDEKCLKHDQTQCNYNIEQASSSNEACTPKILKIEEINVMRGQDRRISSKINNETETLASRNKPFRVLQPKFISMLKSLLSEKVDERLLSGIQLHLKVDEIIDNLESEFKEFILNGVLGKAIDLYLASNAPAMLQNQDGRRDISESVIRDVRDIFRNLEPSFTSSSVQTISSGPIISQNRFEE